MEITHMTYARVAAGAVPGPPKLRPVDEGISNFLSDHIKGLLKITQTRKTLPGRFIDGETRSRFRELAYGTDEDLLSASDILTKLLIGKMDRRTAPGLLVCLRAAAGREVIAGALKLQVVAEHAAILEALDNGEEVLSAVTKLLDKPGDLQKGALVLSTLPDGQVLTGDRLERDAAYFPAAFEIQTFTRPSESIGELLGAIAEVEPALTIPVADALPSLQPAEPRLLLATLGNQIPELTQEIQAGVADRLEQRPKPVGRIDTSRAGIETLQVGQIKISGPVLEMQRNVARQILPDGTWQLVIESPEAPKQTFR